MERPQSESGATTTPSTVKSAAVPELPADAVPLVLALLDGDVSALCASACVCKRWRDLLLSNTNTSAELWRVLRVPPHLARRLSDERLLMLVARARGGLRC